MSKQLTLKVKKEVNKRAMGNGNVPLCEKCRSELHNLEYHHEPPKGMGGSKRRYTKDNVLKLCLKCHEARTRGEWKPRLDPVTGFMVFPLEIIKEER